MSSFVRRIQRQVLPSQKVHYHLDADGNPQRDSKGRIKPPYANPARTKFYQRRGSRLGVKNPKGRELVARLRREAKRSSTKVGS